MTNLREYLSQCGKGLLIVICVGAALVAITGSLYANGVVDVDRFLAVVWSAISALVMYLVLCPPLIAAMWLHDRRHGRRSS